MKILFRKLVNTAVVTAAIGAGALVCAASCTGTPAVCTVNLADYSSSCGGTGQTASYGVCPAGIYAAVQAAAAHFSGGINPNDTWNIKINGDKFDLSTDVPATGTKGIFDITGLWPAGTGSVNFVGASNGHATFIIPNAYGAVYGENISHVHFSYVTFEDAQMTVSQGVVVTPGSGQKGYIDVTVPSGFPTPNDLYNLAVANNGSFGGGYIRAYTNTTTPQLINTDSSNTQIGWSADPTLVSGSTWRIYFTSSTKAVPSVYYSGTVVACVKAPGVAGGYFLSNIGHPQGTDVGFDHVTWYDQARGVFRNIIKPFVTNSYILPRAAISGQGPCMATPDGGPQFGQPGDTAYTLTGVNVTNLYADRTGDDTIAIFNAGSDTTSSVTGSTINGSFARDINLYYSCHVNVPFDSSLCNGGAGGNCGGTGTVNTITDCTTWGGYATPADYQGCITDTANVCTNFPL